MGVEAAAGETPSLTGEHVEALTERPTWGLECAQAHALGNPAPEGSNLIVGSRGSDYNLVERGANAIAPSGTLPHIQHHSAVTALPSPGEHLRLCPFM